MRILSDMESSPEYPTAAEAATALAGAEASRARLAQRILTPSWFSASLGVVIAVQIATTAVGLVEERPLVLVAGLVLFAIAAAAQLLRFRRLNGVWLGGFVSRVVLGTGTAASVSYVVALGLAVWAAFAEAWWAVALCSIAGGAGYAMAGRRWLRAYRDQPDVHGRGEPALWLAVLTVAALAGLVVLVALG